MRAPRSRSAFLHNLNTVDPRAPRREPAFRKSFGRTSCASTAARRSSAQPACDRPRREPGLRPEPGRRAGRRQRGRGIARRARQARRRSATRNSSACRRRPAPRSEVGGHPCQGIYWTPKGQRPRVALIATHYNVDFAEHYLAPYIATRGYGFLGWNTRYRGAEDLFTLEHALIDIGAGVKWLRDQGVERVVILGNSGGGSLMGAYQAEATAPTLAAGMQGAARAALESLPKADLYISLNAHSGRPEVLTNWLDPSVTDERDPVATDQSLNMYNKENGPPYSDAFITRYRAAQRARNQRITDWCKAELKRLNAAGIPDYLFPLFRAWADLRFMDGAHRSVRPRGAGLPIAAIRRSRTAASGSGAPARCAAGSRCGAWRPRNARGRSNSPSSRSRRW